MTSAPTLEASDDNTAPRAVKLSAANHDHLRDHNPFTFEVAHRRLAWCFRLSAMINVALVLVLIILGAAFASVFPLKEVRFVFLREEVDTNKVIRVEPVSKNVAGYDILLESKAREFVELVLPIDELTETERYQKAFRMASGDFYDKFKRDRLDSGFLAQAKKDRLNRSIRIEAVDVRRNPANNETHLVSVDIMQIDRFGNAEASRQRPLRIFLEMTALPQSVPEQELYTNPLGIVVLNMTTKERNS